MIPFIRFEKRGTIVWIVPLFYRFLQLVDLHHGTLGAGGSQLAVQA